MPDCSFCGDPLEKGKGVLYVKKDGKPFYYCSSKCRKNSLGLKREGRRKKWTTSYRTFMASKGKAKKSAAKPIKEAPKKSSEKPVEEVPKPAKEPEKKPESKKEESKKEEKK